MSNCRVYLSSVGASDRTVVLAGPYIAQLPGGNEFAKVPNPLLCEPVDTVKQQGYMIQSVTMYSAGTQKTIRTYTT